MTPNSSRSPLHRLCLAATLALGLLPLLLRAAQDATLAPPPEPAKPAAESLLDPALPTLWIAGDSTAANGGPAATGWGVPLPSYFDLKKINLANRSRGGRSSRTFITEGLWEKLLAGVKAGDTVLIQFGHNDAGAINEASRARGSIRGLGDETQEIDNLLTKKPEVVRTFGAYLRQMVADVKAKNATPILLSLTVRNEWREGRVERTNGQWGPWSAEIAKTAGVAFIDLTTLIADDYERRGADAVKPFFPKDHTHTDPAGADLNASLVVAGLKSLRGNPFAALFSAKSESIAAAPASTVVNPPAPTASSRTRRPLPEPADPKLPSLILIGDSTVRNGQDDGQGKGAEGQWGWGHPLAAFFDAKKINVVNRAVGGLSSRTFLTGGHWERALAFVKPGDFVVMQFGHNDNGAINDASRARASIKGIGDESQEIDNVLTKKSEVVHSYGWYLRKFIDETKAKGATPIVCSLVPRKMWDTNGKINRNKSDYAGWAEQVALREKVGFIDLNEMIARRYDELGHDQVMTLFPLVTPDEHTHTNQAGAELNAACVIAGLKSPPGNPLAPYFSEKARDVAPLSGKL